MGRGYNHSNNRVKNDITQQKNNNNKWILTISKKPLTLFAQRYSLRPLINNVDIEEIEDSDDVDIDIDIDIDIGYWSDYNNDIAPDIIFYV